MTRSRAGRPSHVPTDETRNMVESLSGFGIPQDEIARLVGIDPKTLRFHYVDQIELGSIKATAKVAQNLFTMACKPSCGAGCCATIIERRRDGPTAAPIIWPYGHCGRINSLTERPSSETIGQSRISCIGSGT